MKPIEIYDKNNVLVINWTLNSICTYHCTYCPDLLHRGTNTIIDKLQDRTILENFLSNLKNEVGDRPVHIFLNGVEPTISPHFEFLCDKFNEYNWYCHVNTNGTRSMAWWIEHAPKLYKVTLSYHPEWDNTDIFEKMDAVGKLTNTGVFVSTSFTGVMISLVPTTCQTQLYSLHISSRKLVNCQTCLFSN
jgi:organic radical activating enzyme